MSARLTQKVFDLAWKLPFQRRFGLSGTLPSAATTATLPDDLLGDNARDSAISNRFFLRGSNATDTEDVEIAQVDADNNLRLGGEAVAPLRSSSTFYLNALTGTPNQTVFLAMFPCKITSISCEYATANGAALTAQITHETGTQAPAAGTTVMTNKFDLNTTTNTIQTATLPDQTTTGTPNRSEILMKTGDRLSIKFSGAVTSLAGVAITIYYNPGAKGHVEFYMMSANASIATTAIFLANRAMTVKGVSAIWGTKGSDAGAVTLDVTKDTSTNAPGAGTTCLGATVNLKGTANTVTSPALTATAATLLMAAGDRISVKFTGTLTALANIVVAVWFAPTYQRKEVTFSLAANGSLATQPFFVADGDYEIVDISEIHATQGSDAGGAHVALTVEGGTTAPGSGLVAQTDNSSAGFDVHTIANNTVQVATLATLRNRCLPTGGRLSVKFAGVLTALAGVVVSVSLRKRS